jgi:hypothetical protein
MRLLMSRWSDAMSEFTWGQSGPAPAAIMIGAIGVRRTGVEIITNITIIDDFVFGTFGPVTFDFVRRQLDEAHGRRSA